MCNISRKDFLFETLLSVQCHLGRVRQRSADLRTSAKRADSDYPAHAQSIIRAIALHSYILQYPLILLADSEGPYQTAPKITIALEALSDPSF